MRGTMRLAFLLGALLAVGCGGVGQSLQATTVPRFDRSTWKFGPFSEPRYLARADAICQRYRKQTKLVTHAFGQLRRRQASDSTKSQAASELRSVASATESEAQKLRQLQPPQRFYEGMRVWLLDRHQEAQMAREFATALDSGDYGPLADTLTGGEVPGIPGAGLGSPDGTRVAFAYSTVQQAGLAAQHLNGLGFKYCDRE